MTARRAALSPQQAQQHGSSQPAAAATGRRRRRAMVDATTAPTATSTSPWFSARLRWRTCFLTGCLIACCVAAVPPGSPASGVAIAQTTTTTIPIPPRRPSPAPQPPDRASSPSAHPPAVEKQPGEAAGAGAFSVCVAALSQRYGPGVRPVAKTAGATAQAGCEIVDPVAVEAMTIGAQAVAFEPPVTLSCEMATRVGEWLDNSAAPLTRGFFYRELSALRVGGCHECRRRNRSDAGLLSEHATARALDIFEFRLDDGGTGVMTITVKSPSDDRQRRFLTALRQSACGAFSTSLGPGADSSHADHLHVDIQLRRTASARFCQ